MTAQRVSYGWRAKSKRTESRADPGPPQQKQRRGSHGAEIPGTLAPRCNNCNRARRNPAASDIDLQSEDKILQQPSATNIAPFCWRGGPARTLLYLYVVTEKS